MEFRGYIVGTSGVGKTTLGRSLAEDLALDHIELDDLYWGENWTPRDAEEVAGRLRERVAGTSWVATGNYSMLRPIILERATHLVWLNYSAITIAGQLLPRTFRRAWTGERLFGGCVETFRLSFLSGDSILLWAAKTFHSNRRRYRELIASDACATIDVVELRTRQETQQWRISINPSDEP